MPGTEDMVGWQEMEDYDGHKNTDYKYGNSGSDLSCRIAGKDVSA
jgi:hypothetical protein